MAAASLSPPGTEFGPCEDACGHRDCARTRQMAATVCRFCEKPIGYDRRFYQGPEGPDDLDHASCLEDSL